MDAPEGPEFREEGPPHGHRLAAAVALGLIIAAGTAVALTTDLLGGTSPTGTALSPRPTGSAISGGTPSSLPSGDAPGLPIATAWRVLEAPSVLGLLTAGACVSATECWAVGTSTTVDTCPGGTAVIDLYDGTGWTPEVGAQVPCGVLNAVACPSVADCWAVGWGSVGPLLEHFDGTGWAPAENPPLAGGLDGIACPTTGECWAVGGSSTSPAGEATLIERFDGGAWSVVAGPSLGGGTGAGNEARLHGVACLSGTDCWAVGESDGGLDGLVEHLSGGSWRIAPSPDLRGPGGTGSHLDAVACPTSGTCWAAGGGVPAEGPLVIEQLGGGVWRLVQVPGQVTTEIGELTGLGCASATDCWAVGGAGLTGLAEQYRGKGWTAMRAPDPAGGAVADPQGVTCDASGRCVMVGYTVGVGTADQGTLLETTATSG